MMEDSIDMDDFTDEFMNPVSDYVVVTLGVDWMVRGYVKENRQQDNYMSSWIRVGDIPGLLTQVYGLSLYQEEGGGFPMEIISCSEVEIKEGAYLLAPLPQSGESPFASAASEGVWLEKGWNPAWRSLWLGDDVCLRANEDDVFHRVQEIAAPCGIAYKQKFRICSCFCAGYRRWVKPAGVEQPVIQVESPKMLRLVLSGVRENESEPPCAIKLARTFSLFNVWGLKHSSFSITVHGRCITEEEAMLFPAAECYSSIADSYCEEI